MRKWDNGKIGTTAKCETNILKVDIKNRC